jgi:hypothetical protein
VITELPHLKVSLQFLVHEAFHFVLSCAFSNRLVVVAKFKICDVLCEAAGCLGDQAHRKN